MNAATSRAATAKALLAAVSLLVLGGVLGIAVDRHVLSRPTVAGTAGFHELAALQDRLNLNASQRRQMDSIISAHREAMQRTWAVLHADFGASLDSIHNSIEAVLTPEQRNEFRAWVREMHGGPGH